jgi:CheY-like chemotaxis protein
VDLPVAEAGGAPPAQIGVRRALVVDGQFINRTIMERQLGTCGIDVVQCRSAADALIALQQDSAIDLLVTDQDLPEMDGLDLAQKARQAGYAVPIVLLSSNPAAVRALPQADILAVVLQKPVLRSDLYRRLQGLSGPAAPPEARPLPPPSAGRLMRVLAAEDNRTNQLVFRKMTKHLAIDLVFANNGREAVEMFQSWQPDLIIMDVSMPELDGRDATRAIRALEAHLGGHVPIVALTAHAMEGDETGILASGMDRYLTKPLRKSAITDVIVAFCPPDARPVASAVELEAG